LKLENVRSLHEIYQHLQNQGGQEDMLSFVDSVADILRSKPLVYSVSAGRLCFTTESEPEHGRVRGVVITASGDHVNLSYDESWKDGHFDRTRRDQIWCRSEYAREALLEMLGRLNV
jgi:hypothetical protein